MGVREGALLAVAVLSATGALGYPGVILRHPETRTTTDGGRETFVCLAQGDVLWYIDNRWLSSSYQSTLQGKGFTFAEADPPDYSLPTTNLTMTVPAREDLNGTEIHCRTAGSDGIVVYSANSYLWIAGPPLPPNVSVELTSWNTMRLSWTAPFTAQGFPIDKYIVHTTNSSTGQRTRTDVYPTDGSETLTIVDTPSNCHSLSFEVEAESSAGTSSASLISRGFPVGVSEFMVNVSVILSLSKAEAYALFTFQLPEVCATDSGVAATYIVELRTSSGELVHRTAAEYHDSILIEETQTVDTCSSYTLNVTVSVPSFPELGSHTNITNFDVQIKCPTEAYTVPTTDSALQEKDSQENGAFMPVVLGVVGVVLLLTLLIGAGLAVVCLQQRRRKTVSLRSSHGTSRTLPPMASNPIYDANDVSPVYDVIPEPCAAKPRPLRLQKQVSCDIRYSPTPASLPLTRDRQRRSVSVCQNSFSPETPSPREVDALLRNTFAGSPSPLSQQCGDAQAGGGEGECVYDSLSQKLPPWKEGQERREKEDNDVEREDCYVLMQSNAV